MSLSPKTALARGRACIELEADALHATSKALDEKFVTVVREIESTLAVGKKIIVTGVGKSAHIAEKITGTLNSTGASACFLDATQALHGDLGLVDRGDIALLLSNSGQTAEIVRLIPILRRFGLRIVAMTSRPDSPLALDSDLQLIYQVPREACPLKLAPTSSTTAALALGDAVAMVLLESRGLTREDFARFHPAGHLGMVLLLRVRDIMRSGARLPVLPDTCTLQDAIFAMTAAKSGSIALVTKRTGKLSGILTDGDFRRSALSGPDFLREAASKFMTRDPKVVRDDVLGVDALKLFELHRIDDLIVVDKRGKPIGLIDGQDLPKLKLV